MADYFDMLEAELLGKSFKKSDHRKVLAPKLQGRSEGSIEFKHQNVSGVLVELGLPYIEGYKPRGNYQRLLANEVETFLEQNPGFLGKLAAAPVLDPAQGQTVVSPNFDKIIEAPPQKIIAPAVTSKPWLSRKGRKIDFAERDAANRRLGDLGEQFVFDLERYRLKAAGRDDLAQKVLWASRDIGDGLGFDILSFDATDDSERMLEIRFFGDLRGGKKGHARSHPAAGRLIVGARGQSARLACVFLNPLQIGLDLPRSPRRRIGLCNPGSM